MAKIGSSTVEVGDTLRRDSDQREGTVTEVSGDAVTLAFVPTFGLDAEWTGPAAECHYNGWDPKAADDKSVPALEPTDMAALAAEQHAEEKDAYGVPLSLLADGPPPLAGGAAEPASAPEAASDAPPATGAPDTSPTPPGGAPAPVTSGP